MASAPGNVSNYGQIHSSLHFLSLEKLPNPRGAAWLLHLHPYLLPACPAATEQGCQPARTAQGKEEEETLQKQLKAQLAQGDPGPGYSTLSPSHSPSSFNRKVILHGLS